jgi:hypothetical protein
MPSVSRPGARGRGGRCRRDDRGGGHGRCPPPPHPARRSPLDRPARRSDPSAAGRGRGHARLLGQAGVRWARDVGAPVRDGGRLLGEPGAGVLAQGGPGRLPARPRRPPHRPGIAVAGVAHQLATLTHSALVTTSSHLPIRRQAAPPMFLARCRAGGRDRDRTCDFCRAKTSPPATRPNRDRPPTPQRRR